MYGQLINNQELESEQNIDGQYRQKASTSIQRYYTSYAVQDGDVKINKSDLVEFLNITLPNYEFELISKPPFWRGRRTDTGAAVDNSDQLSSGESQILSMSFDILTQYSRLRTSDDNLKTLLIDEPDAHIHPDTQANFCKFLALFQKRVGMRIVIATHSLEIVGGLALHCLDRTGCAIVRPMESEIRARPLEGMHSEALSALGGGVLMGRLFGSKLMLVEGEDDHDAWSQAARAGRISATIIPCGGGDRMKKKQKLLEDLFSGLRDPADQPFGIALLDSDKSLPIPTKRNSQNYIRFHRLKCHEIENLVLTDEVLGNVGLNCESALSKLNGWNGASQKSRKLKAISTENRHSVDLKGLMPTLETILFPNMGRWTRIVGNVLASSRPSGQLASFLGDDLVEALYGPEVDECVS